MMNAEGRRRSSSMGSGGEHSCPYAAALQDDSSHKSGDSGSTAEQLHSPHQPPDHLLLNIEKCPAFEAGTCPFRNVKSAQEARETLLKVPPSHLNMSSFYKMVQKFHSIVTNISNNTDDANIAASDSSTTVPRDSFTLPGGCPVKDVVEKAYFESHRTPFDTKQEHVSFSVAMEDLSLAAVMARLAKEMEATTNDDNDDGIIHDGSEELVVEEEAPLKKKAEETSPSEVATTTPSITTTTSTTPPQERKNSLSYCLKTGTAVSHQAAEDVHFVKNFIAGKIPRPLYAQLVTMLYHVYTSLEEALAKHGPTHFSSCHFPHELERKEALLEDLDYWHGSNVIPEMSAATRDYVRRMEYIAQHNPILLLAHAYTRYLGDLSGGRILARVAKRAMQLGDDGLAFYEFANIASPKRFKDQYRQALDELELTPVQVQQLVAEANVAFCLNMRLFEELDVAANVPGAAVRPLQDALAFANINNEDDEVMAGSSSTTKEAGKCPFVVQAQEAQAAELSSSGTAAVVTNSKHKGGGTCPWPFVFLHDPAQGMRDWKTWALIGMVLAWMWSHAVVTRKNNHGE